MTFNEFYNKFYKHYNNYDLFTLEEMNKLNDIYNTSSSLLDFFKVADNYLTAIDKKKYIFIPLQDILDNYNITNFKYKNWIVDIKKAFNHIWQACKDGELDMVRIMIREGENPNI